MIEGDGGLLDDNTTVEEMCFMINLRSDHDGSLE